MDTTARCDACGGDRLSPFADLGVVPVFSGRHWADRSEALASPSGRIVLAHCTDCAYVRNLAHQPELLVPDATTDVNHDSSPAVRRFTVELAARLTHRFSLPGRLVLDLGCGPGDFLRELCLRSGCTAVGHDARFPGPPGPDPSGAVFHATDAPRGGGLPAFDAFVSRHWLDRLADPFEFLADLRVQAADRPVYGYLEVPDACHEFDGAGWEVCYPRVSYFDAYSLHRIATRAGWRVEAAGTCFEGRYRWLEVSANGADPLPDRTPPPGLAERDRQVAAARRFTARRVAERDRWRQAITELSEAGRRPAAWGADPRGVQFLATADPHRRLAAVVDADPRLWGRYLPGAGHRVDPPESLLSLRPEVAVITNPARQREITKSLADLGVAAELRVA